MITCKICQLRRPRRYCPGVEGDICSLCCGTEREVTVNCPLDCEYLSEARHHEKTPLAGPADFPNKDVRITDQFLREHEALLMFLSISLASAALTTPGIVDYDVREAMESLVQTYRTLESGIYYESKPSNAMAARVHEEIQKNVVMFRERAEAGAGRTIRDAEILGVLVFLQRLELQHNNGRPKGRAFIDFLRGNFPHQPRERVLA